MVLCIIGEHSSLVINLGVVEPRDDPSPEIEPGVPDNAEDWLVSGHAAACQYIYMPLSDANKVANSCCLWSVIHCTSLLHMQVRLEQLDAMLKGVLL